MLWRSIQEGPFEQDRNLMSMFLDVVERLLPEQLLKIPGGREVRAMQPGSISWVTSVVSWLPTLCFVA
jgi:hypothetical protein